MATQVWQAEPKPYMPSERALPHNLEAERALLGCILLDPGSLELANDLGPADFFSAQHQLLFQTFVKMAAAQRPLDFVTLCAELTDSGLLEKSGGVAYIASLTDGVPFGSSPGSWGSSVCEYCRIVKNKAAERRTLTEGYELGQAASRGDPTVEIIERAKKLGARSEGQLQAGARPPAQPDLYPEAPRECWHGISKLYLQAHEQSTEASDNYHLASFLVAMGSLFGRYVYVKMGRTIYPNLFAVLVGKSGRARKDTAIDQAVDFLQGVDPEVYIPETIDSREGFIEELSETQKRLEQQKLFGALRFLVRLTELRQLLDKAAQKGAKNIMPTLCAVYDCRARLEVKTRTRPACVTDPVGGFIAGTDPEWLQELTVGDVKAGIGNRVLWIPGSPKARNAEPPSPDSEILNPLKVQVRAIVDYWREQGLTRLTLSEEAQARWKKFYEVELDRREDDELMAVIGERDHATCRKVALIYAALDKSSLIETWHLEPAIAFTNFLHEARYPIFKGHGMSVLAQLDERIKDAARQAPAGEILWRALRNRFRRVDIETFEKRMGWLTREDGPLSVRRLGRLRIVRAEE